MKKLVAAALLSFSAISFAADPPVTALSQDVMNVQDWLTLPADYTNDVGSVNNSSPAADWVELVTAHSGYQLVLVTTDGNDAWLIAAADEPDDGLLSSISAPNPASITRANAAGALWFRSPQSSFRIKIAPGLSLWIKLGNSRAAAQAWR